MPRDTVEIVRQRDLLDPKKETKVPTHRDDYFSSEISTDNLSMKYTIRNLSIKEIINKRKKIWWIKNESKNMSEIGESKLAGSEFTK